MQKHLKKICSVCLSFTLLLAFGGCSSEKAKSQRTNESSSGISSEHSDTAEREDEEMENKTTGAPTLIYQGQASIRIVTAEGKVIYIDPYAGDDYNLAADLILVTHAHFDHNATDKIKNRNPDCQIFTWKEAVVDGVHQTFDLGYVTVEAVEAGFNRMHDVNECAGYILTFSNGKSVYVTGDTSTTEQMPSLAEKEIDYAFFCCDGVYNMGLKEAAECAAVVGAKHNIPYHNTTKNTGDMFDMELAEQFDAPNRLILAVGEELTIE